MNTSKETQWTTMLPEKTEEEKQTLVELAKNSYFANMICKKIIMFAKINGRTCQLYYGGFYVWICPHECSWSPIEFNAVTTTVYGNSIDYKKYEYKNIEDNNFLYGLANYIYQELEKIGFHGKITLKEQENSHNKHKKDYSYLLSFTDTKKTELKDW